MPATSTRHLTSPPIKEALIDIRVRAPELGEPESLSPLVGLAKEQYPIEKKSKFFDITLDIEKEIAKSSEPIVRGYILQNPEQSQVVQFRLDGFTINRIKDYQSWDSLFSEAIRWWQEYVKHRGEVEVERVGVKYINRILLPDSDFPTYLTRPPTRPLGVKGQISNFFYQVQVEAENQITAVITQGTERVMVEGKIPFLFDIDASILIGRPLELAELIEKLEQLHETKAIFFDSFTEATFELCSQ
jgi:uncharacterized protein (TIGR04255 family)